MENVRSVDRAVLWTKTHRFSSSTSTAGSWVGSEYQGFRSLADGARGTPFSVSAGVTFLVALMAAINELWSFEKWVLSLFKSQRKKSQPAPSPRISWYDHWLLVVLAHESNYLQLGLSSRRRPAVSFSFQLYPIHLIFLVVNQCELQSPIKQILQIKLNNMSYIATYRQHHSAVFVFFLLPCFLLILSNLLNIIPAIRMVWLVMGNI